jgi:hypothetical protein
MKAALAVLGFKINTAAYATDAVPTAVDNYLLAQNVDINPLQMETDDYRPVSNKFGSFEKIVGSVTCSVQFDVMVSGGGTPLGVIGQIPNHDGVLRASAMARTISAGTNISYNNIDSGEEDATLYYWVDGILQKIVGLRGSLEWTGTAKRALMMKFTGVGLNVPMTDATLPTPTLPTKPRPLAVNKANTGITIDTSFLARISSFVITQGNDVQYRNLTNREDVSVVGRQMSGKVTLEMPLVAEKDFLGANGLCTLATVVPMFITHGTTAGNRVLFNMPNVQLFNPKPRTESGILMLDCDLHMVRNEFAVFYQ